VPKKLLSTDFTNYHGLKNIIKIISLRLCAAPAGGQEKNLCDLCVK
jgi:hypothetical protein